MLKDSDIRKPLIAMLKEKNKGSNYRIIPEMAICDGLSRADIVVANDILCGYEIKSDADTLERLPIQKECYGKTFDKVFIVVGEKFESSIADAVPDWWGIFLARQCKNGKVRFTQKRCARRNTDVTAASLLELLWREEVDALLKQHGIKGLSGKNRRILRKMVIENVSFTEIRDYTRETLKHRTGWR